MSRLLRETGEEEATDRGGDGGGGSSGIFKLVKEIANYNYHYTLLVVVRTRINQEEKERGESAGNYTIRPPRTQQIK